MRSSLDTQLAMVSSSVSRMANTTEIVVTATLSSRDVQRANFSIYRSRTNWWRTLLLAVVLSAILFPGLSVAYHDTGGSLGLAAMFVIGILFGIVLWLFISSAMLFIAYVLSFYGAWSLTRNNPHALGPVTYRFSESGYSYSGLNGSGQTLWSAFPKIDETRKQFLLYPIKTLAYIVPKRSFAAESDVQELRRLLQNSYKGELKLHT